MKPLIRRSNLTPGDEGPRYWCLTKYTVGKHGAVDLVDASEKWDVTDQVTALFEELLHEAAGKALEDAGMERAAEARG